MIVHIKKEFTFEASHQLPNHDGKCARVHGHSWKLCVGVGGEVQTTGGPKEGMVVDFADLKARVAPLLDRLDHHHLGWGRPNRLFIVDRPEEYLDPEEMPFLASDEEVGLPQGFVPTSENLIIWIGAELIKLGVEWEMLSLDETCTSSAMLTRLEYAWSLEADRQREGYKRPAMIQAMIQGVGNA